MSNNSPADVKEEYNKESYSYDLEHASITDACLFFWCGIGSSLCQFSVLSCLVHFSQIYGSDSYIYINLAIFAPLVPVALIQAAWDLHLDRKHGSYLSILLKGSFGFISNIIVTLYFITFVSDFASLCWSCFAIGFSSSIIFNLMTQLASFASRCGRCKAAFSLGYQASGFVALIGTLVTDFGRSKSEKGKIDFFLGMVTIESVCFLMFLWLVNHCEMMQHAMTRRDSISQQPYIELKKIKDDIEYEDGSTADETADETEDEDEDEDEETAHLNKQSPVEMVELSYMELSRRSWIICTCLSVTIMASMAIGASFTLIKSPTVILPQVLFFTRLFLDTLGRPATLLCPLPSERSLPIVTFLRLIIATLFFLFGFYGDRYVEYNDSVLVVLVAMLSFSSGFIVTTCYQLAPRHLLPKEEGSLTKLASLLNLAFSISVFVGVSIPFIWLKTISILQKLNQDEIYKLQKLL